MDREQGEEGYYFWVGVLDSGADHRAVAEDMVKSEEFIAQIQILWHRNREAALYPVEAD